MTTQTAGTFRVGIKSFRSEVAARTFALTVANRQQREVAVTWNSWAGTERALVAKVSPNRKPRQAA